MPSTRRAAQHDAPTIPQRQHEFHFPVDSHLLVTTSRHIYAWDQHGTRPVFHSSSGGIVAARAAKDGSGILAVASSNVVVMHDTKRGRQDSWGLNAPHEQVRHLEYSPDSKSLFLSTTTDGTIHCFDTETSRLIAPTQKHEEAPVALAVSSTGHLVLSASHDPPVVYLKNLSHNTTPLHIQPNASHSPVSSAAFHPERPNIFLLAFRDGTIAAYDAARMPRGHKTTFPDMQNVNDGEIARVSAVHRPTRIDEQLPGKSMHSSPVAGVAFLTGFKTRAVTAGRDGKCKLIDIAKGGVTLRTWHTKAPLTSLAVLNVKSGQREHVDIGAGVSRRSTRSSGIHTIGGPSSTDNIIAVGRIDGQVQLYNTVGLLLAKQNVSCGEERILSMEWVKGPAPQPLHNITMPQQIINPVPTLTGETMMKSILPDHAVSEVSPPTSQSPLHNLGSPPDLQQTQSRKLAFHPDELEEGTVRYTPVTKVLHNDLPEGAQYLDLFSPVRPGYPPIDDARKARITSPRKNRPRLSSQTFVKSPRRDSRHGDPQFVSSKSPELDSNISPTHKPPAPDLIKKREVGLRKYTASTTNAGESIFATVGDGLNRVSDVDLARSWENAKILGDLRKLAGANKSPNMRGTMTSFASSQRLRSGVIKRKSPSKASTTQHAIVNHHQQHTINSNTTALTDDHDIWMTSPEDDDDDDADQIEGRARRRRPNARPSARQTSSAKSDVHGGTIPKTSIPPHPEEIAMTGTSLHPNGSVEEETEEAFAPAASHVSPNRTCMPASEEVRGLFPRSSSLLSTHAKKHSKRGARPSPLRDATLTSMAVNAAVGRVAKSPWARLRAGRPASKAVQVYEDSPLETGALHSSQVATCAYCPEVKGRVQSLENEVAHLKGEVLALKAVLRRNGMQVPSMRHKR